MVKFFLFIGIGALVISGLFIGVFTYGSQQRGNFFSETKEYRDSRTKYGFWFGGIGVVSLGIAGISYWLM